MTLKLNRVRAVVKVHVRAKYHQAECSNGLWVIVYTQTFLPYLIMVKVPWPWPITLKFSGFQVTCPRKISSSWVQWFMSYRGHREKELGRKQYCPSLPRRR